MTIKTLLCLFAFLAILLFVRCDKQEVEREIIPIPNGDFELWDDALSLLDWQTNSCPLCEPPFETYIVQKDTNAYHGKYGAKFIYNQVYKSRASNKFLVAAHPSIMEGYVWADMAAGDTVMINIDLFSGKDKVDSGSWFAISSIASFEKIEIPLTQSSLSADSACIKIQGGGKEHTILYLDNLSFIKYN